MLTYHTASKSVHTSVCTSTTTVYPGVFTKTVDDDFVRDGDNHAYHPKDHGESDKFDHSHFRDPHHDDRSVNYDHDGYYSDHHELVSSHLAAAAIGADRLCQTGLRPIRQRPPLMSPAPVAPMRFRRALAVPSDCCK